MTLLCGGDVTDLTSDTLNNGQNEVPFIKLTPLAVTIDNIADTVIADGFRTWEEIASVTLSSTVRQIVSLSGLSW